MPGFGSGPFGGGGFGEYDWAKHSLFGLAPDIYRDLDADRLFEAFAEGQGESFDNLRRKIRDFGDLRDPLYARTKNNLSVVLRLGQKIPALGEIERFGISAHVLSNGALVTDTGRFTFADIGKTISIERSLVAGNNRLVTLVGIVDGRSVVTSPALAEDSGPLRWMLRSSVVADGSMAEYEIASGSVDEITLGCVLSDGFSEIAVLGRQQFPSSSADRTLYTEREGEDGYFDGFGNFRSGTASFQQTDMGKKIVVVGSSNSANVGRFEIVDVLGSDSVALNAEGVLDAGPLSWSILRRGRLKLDGSIVVKGVIEQFGSNMVILSSDTVSSPSADFTSSDVGKILSIRSSTATHNGSYEIREIISRSAVRLNASFIVDSAACTWEVRTPTLIGDGTQVEVKTFSLLAPLAKDFGIEVDDEDSDEFQRRWVSSVARWTPLKGSLDGYRFVGELTGFDVEVSPLYRVSEAVSRSLGSAVVLSAGEEAEGRHGTNGSLTTILGRLHFFDPSALFTPSDIGLQIQVVQSGAGNNGLRTIAEVVSTTEVIFDYGYTATPERNVDWQIVRMYSTQAPALPVYDEVNADLMTSLKGEHAFVIDKYCFEDDWDTKIGVDGDGVFVILGSDPSSATPTPITIEVFVYGDANVVVGTGLGRWKITDSASRSYFVEGPPTMYLEAGAGRTGANGSFSSANVFTAPTAVFTTADVGRQISIGSSGSGNNGIHRITARLSATSVQLSENVMLPEARNSSLVWSVVSWSFKVVANAPPENGAATLEYLCPKSESTCDYCHSSKILVRGHTPYAMNDPFEKLSRRLNQVKPASIEIVYDVGIIATATVEISAVIGAYVTDSIAALGGSVGLLAQPMVIANTTAPLGALLDLVATSRVIANAASALAGTAGATAGATAVLSTTAALAGTGALALAGTTAIPSTSTLAGSAALAVAGGAQSGTVVEAVGAGVLAAVGNSIRSASVALEGSSTIHVATAISAAALAGGASILVAHNTGTVNISAGASLDIVPGT